MQTPVQVVSQQVPETVYVSFSAEISPATSESLLATCANLANAKVKNVHLLLSTPGGHVMNGLTIHNVLRGMPFNLITHNTGAVNSIGNVIFLAGAERYACPNATFMFHGVGFDVTQAMRFEEKNLKERLDGLQADQRKIGAVIAGRTNLDEAEVEQLFFEAVTRDVGYALTKGIIHEVREVSIPAGAPIQQLVFKR